MTVHFEKNGLSFTDHHLYVEHSSIDLVCILNIAIQFERALELVQIAGMKNSSHFPHLDVHIQLATDRSSQTEVRIGRSHLRELDRCLQGEGLVHLRKRKGGWLQIIGSAWLEKCGEHVTMTRWWWTRWYRIILLNGITIPFASHYRDFHCETQSDPHHSFFNHYSFQMNSQTSR